MPNNRVPAHVGNVERKGVRHFENTPNATPAESRRPVDAPYSGASAWDQDLQYHTPGRCAAFTKAGSPCEAYQVEDSDYCYFHTIKAPVKEPDES